MIRDIMVCFVGAACGIGGLCLDGIPSNLPDKGCARARGGSCHVVRRFNCWTAGKRGDFTCDERCTNSCTNRSCASGETDGGCPTGPAGRRCGHCFDTLYAMTWEFASPGQQGMDDFTRQAFQCSPSGTACEYVNCCATDPQDPLVCVDVPTGACSCSCACINPFDCAGSTIGNCSYCTGLSVQYWLTGNDCVGS